MNFNGNTTYRFEKNKNQDPKGLQSKNFFSVVIMSVWSPNVIYLVPEKCLTPVPEALKGSASPTQRVEIIKVLTTWQWC